VGKPEGKNHQEDLDVGGSMDHREDGVVWTGLMWLRIGISEELL
jgi:hypothetical protein